MADAIPNDENNKSLIADDTYKDIISKLINAGYTSPRELAFPTVLDIAKKLKISPYLAEQYSIWALQKLEQSHVLLPFLSSANEMYLDRTERLKLSTGCYSLDKMLSGGIERGALTQFYGSSGAGKTQLCYSLLVMVQQPTTIGGLAGAAIHIDTENKFSPERILEIARMRGFDTETILKNIRIVNAINTTHQKKALEYISHIAEKDDKVKLVIVDSMINLYRQEFSGRQNLSERQSKLENCVRLLVKVAQLYDIAIVFTNQVSSLTDSYYRESVVPAGGNVLAYASKHRIHLKSYGQNIQAEIVSSASLARTTARFTINQSGISDINIPNNHPKL